MSFSPLTLNWCSNWYFLRVRLPSSVLGFISYLSYCFEKLVLSSLLRRGQCSGLQVRVLPVALAGKSNQDVRWAHNPEVRVQIPLPLFHMFISFIHKKKQFICFFLSSYIFNIGGVYETNYLFTTHTFLLYISCFLFI
jgi:hypothetical protein